MTILPLSSRLRVVVPTAALLALVLLPMAAGAAPELRPPAVAPTSARAATAPTTVPSTRPTAGVWPLRPRPAVVHRFDPPMVRWGRGHRGVDLAGRTGQQVRAAVAGRVTFAGRIAGVGTVAVGHGATRTTYQPVDPAVRRGDPVAAGQPLGRLAWHGTHCAPAACLHWGLLRGERYLDPLSLLDAPGPVRLLPSA
jgi:murein DD-endopeptidase MepM/ murein hydrolase activator NlpD